MASKPVTAYSYAAHIERVVDGDTLDVRVDLGFQIAYSCRLRLRGVNAPEMNTPAGRRAKQWVLSWLEEHAPAGQVQLLTRKADGDADKYGRYLAVINTVDGASLNADLLTNDQAVPYMV